MVLDLECLQEPVENFYHEEELREEENFLLKQIMIKFESLKKNAHFQIVLKNKVINNDLFTVYRAKNFIKSAKTQKRIVISFVVRKKTGNAVRRNRIRRKIKSIVQKLIKMNNLINLKYTYIIFGKEKAYKEKYNSLFEKMEKSFKRMNNNQL